MRWAIWVEDKTLPEDDPRRRQMIGVADLVIADNLYRGALEETPNMGAHFGFTSVELTNIDREERLLRENEFNNRTGG